MLLLSPLLHTGAPTMKSKFAQVLALSLQRSLHSSHADPDAIVPLLSTITCLLSGEEDLTHLQQLSNSGSGGGRGTAGGAAALRGFQLTLGLVRDHTTNGGGEGGGGGGGISASAEDFKHITFPELLHWVWSCSNKASRSGGSGNGGGNGGGSSGGNGTVAATAVAVAVCRLLGKVSVVDRSHRAVGNLLSEDMISVLCDAYANSSSVNNNSGSGGCGSNSGEVLACVSSAALWHIVHHSEKAKSMVKEYVNSKSGNSGGSYSGKYVGGGAAQSVAGLAAGSPGAFEFAQLQLRHNKENERCVDNEKRSISFAQSD